MLLDLALPHLVGDPVSLIIALEDTDAYGSRDAAWVGVNYVLDHPGCKEYALTHVGPALLTEQVDQEPKERIGRQFPRPQRAVEVSVVEQPRLDIAFEDTTDRVIAVHVRQDGIHVDRVSDPRCFETAESGIDEMTRP